MKFFLICKDKTFSTPKPNLSKQQPAHLPDKPGISQLPDSPSQLTDLHNPATGGYETPVHARFCNQG
jgi:hypothetical protein